MIDLKRNGHSGGQTGRDHHHPSRRSCRKPKANHHAQQSSRITSRLVLNLICTETGPPHPCPSNRVQYGKGSNFVQLLHFSGKPGQGQQIIMVSGAGGQLKTMQAVSQVQSSGAGGGVKMVMVTSGQLAQVCSLTQYFSFTLTFLQASPGKSPQKDLPHSDLCLFYFFQSLN